MSITAVVRAMVEAKATPEMILAVVESMEKEQVDKLEQRRKVDRERQQRKRGLDNCHVMSRDTFGQSVTPAENLSPSSCPPVPPSFPAPLLPPLTPQTPSPYRREPQARAKISLDELSVDHIRDWLAKKRTEGKYLDHNPHEVLEIFKDYCHANGKKYSDYVAAYRNAFSWDKCQPGSANSGGKQKAERRVDAPLSALLKLRTGNKEL